MHHEVDGIYIIVMYHCRIVSGSPLVPALTMCGVVPFFIIELQIHLNMLTRTFQAINWSGVFSEKKTCFSWNIPIWHSDDI